MIGPIVDTSGTMFPELRSHTVVVVAIWVILDGQVIA
jgi:hypothetical protein